MTVTGTASIYAVAELSPLPTGATRNYALAGAPPFNPAEMTIVLPQGIVTDAMSGLKEVADSVAPYVGITQVTGKAYCPAWKRLSVGAHIVDPSSRWSLTGNEIVTAVVFDDESQKLEYQFTDRLGQDVTVLSEQFVDQRAYRKSV